MSGGWWVALSLIFGLANLFLFARQVRKKSWRGQLGSGIFALLFLSLATLGIVGDPQGIQKLIVGSLGSVATPVSITGLSWGLLVVFLWKPRFFTRGGVAWSMLNIFVLGALTAIGSSDSGMWVFTGDHLAVFMAAGATAFFVWFGIRQAVINDDRVKAGGKPWEAVYAEKVPTWPDLVYIEAVCALLVLAGLTLWGLAVKAPLEAPANPAVTPNPAKAPWYFVGIQELLVYFDAAIAGTVLPLLALIGLLVLPFLDTNPRGNGYYTLKERPIAISLFLFGFLGLWWFLILFGMFFRGADWSFVGIAGSWEHYSEVGRGGRNLSAIFWEECIGTTIFSEADRFPRGYRFVYSLVREAPGVLVLGGYFVGLPVWLARTWCREIYNRLGRRKYWFFKLLILMMFFVPVKMVLRWLCNLNYVVALPEWRLFL